MPITLEICCATLADVENAYRGGADRIELNSAFPLGGLTPTLAVLRLSRKICSLPIAAMVRPRAGGFCYTQPEFETMVLDARILLEEGVEAIVFGCLTRDKLVDTEKTRILTDLAHSYGREAVFHKAFDCIADQDQALQQLIELGVDRVLTSAGGTSAPAQAEKLAHFIAAYGDRITILPGGGIRPGNVKDLLTQTGAKQVHSSCGGFLEDPTVAGNQVSYAYRTDISPQLYETVDTAQVKALREALDT